MGRPPKREKVAVPAGGWQKPKTPVVDIRDITAAKVPVLDLDHAEIKQRRLVWRFNEIDKGGDWPPAMISAKELADLLHKMADFESMRIGEIFKPGSEHGKTYPVERLPAATRKRLEELERDDETEIARLRCGGAPRLYGFLREHVFHVIWWDPTHAVYPSKKKNT